MIKVNLKMVDGSELKEVCLFKFKELGDSLIDNKNEILKMFNENNIIWFSGNYIQGCFIPQKISSYEFIDDDNDVSSRLLDFIKDSSGIWDINYTDVRDWIMYNRNNLLKILR